MNINKLNTSKESRLDPEKKLNNITGGTEVKSKLVFKIYNLAKIQIFIRKKLMSRRIKNFMKMEINDKKRRNLSNFKRIYRSSLSIFYTLDDYLKSKSRTKRSVIKDWVSKGKVAHLHYLNLL